MQYGQSHVESVKRDSRAFLEFGMSVVATIFALLWATSLRAEDNMVVSHGYSFYGDLTYGPDYTHFD